MGGEGGNHQEVRLHNVKILPRIIFHPGFSVLNSIIMRLKRLYAQPTHFLHKGTKVQGLSLACPKSYGYNPLFIWPPRAALTFGAGDLYIFLPVTKSQ